MTDLVFMLNNTFIALSATEHGCDIFKNGKYVDTILDSDNVDKPMPKEYWYGRAIETLLKELP